MAKLIIIYRATMILHISDENITIKHIDVKINIPKSKTNKKLKNVIYLL